MLRKIAGFKTQKDWDNNSRALRKPEALKQLQAEIQEITEREVALAKVATIDGIIGLPLVIHLLTEIRDEIEKEIEEIFTALTGKNIKQAITNDTIRNIFKKILKKDVRDILENLADQARSAEINEERLQEILEPFIDNLYMGLIKEHLAELHNLHSEAAFKQLLRNEIFLICASELFQEADKRQTANMFTIITLMGPYKLKSYPDEAIKNPFIGIQFFSKLISASDKTRHLWQTFSLYLEGFHERALNQISDEYKKEGVVQRLADGTYPLSNGNNKDNDKKFKDNFNLTFYDIAYIYFQTSLTLQSVLSPNEALEKEISIACTQVSVDLEKEECEDKEDIIEAKQNTEVTENSGVTVLKFNLFKTPESSKLPLTFDLLENLKLLEPASKFSLLITYLNDYTLNEKQLSRFKEFTNVIIATLEGYTNSSWTSHALPLPTSLVRRAHTQKFTENIALLKYSANDPAEQIKILFKLWQKVESEGGKESKEKLVGLLNAAYEILRVASVPTDEMGRSMMLDDLPKGKKIWK